LILLDTSVLSLTYRRRRRGQHTMPGEVAELARLIEQDLPLAIPGIVLQELLSGLRDATELARLRATLAGFPVITATMADHLAAAEIANACRARGIAGATIDCLIAAQAIGGSFALFTLDRDFARIARCCKLALWPASRPPFTSPA
jgi:predicted nucleic acid-binding protein